LLDLSDSFGSVFMPDFETKMTLLSEEETLRLS